MEPESIDELLAEQPPGRALAEMLWTIKDYTRSSNPAWYLLEDDEFNQLVDKYLVNPDGPLWL